MAKLLSVKQFAALALGQTKPPWHFGYLNWLYNQNSISLKSSIEALSAAQTVIFVQVGTYSGLIASQGLNIPAPLSPQDADELFTWGWAGNGWSASALAPLAAILKPNGVEICYLGRSGTTMLGEPDDDNVVGLVGTYADFVSLNVTQVPAYPSTWSADEAATATKANFLLNEITGVTNFAGGNDNSNNPYALPLAALYPGQSSDKVGTGLLRIVSLNQGVNTTQFQISIFAATRNFLLSVLNSEYTLPLPQAIDAVVASITNLQAWLGNALTTVLGDVPATSQFAIQASVPVLTVSEVTYEVQDGTGATFTTSALTVNSDGTATGGVTSS
jgi:hypothetical protein